MKSKLKYCFVLALLALLPGCDLELAGGTNPGDDQPEFQTEILAVLVEPDPVVAGDTATFTCIIRDSLDTGFRFRWFLEGSSPVTTNTNQLHWKAPVEPGDYNHIVEARKDGPGDWPSRLFKVRVIRK